LKSSSLLLHVVVFTIYIIATGDKKHQPLKNTETIFFAQPNFLLHKSIRCMISFKQCNHVSPTLPVFVPEDSSGDKNGHKNDDGHCDSSNRCKTTSSLLTYSSETE